MKLNQGAEVGTLLVQGVLAGLALASVYIAWTADDLESFITSYEVRRRDQSPSPRRNDRRHSPADSLSPSYAAAAAAAAAAMDGGADMSWTFITVVVRWCQIIIFLSIEEKRYRTRSHPHGDNQCESHTTRLLETRRYRRF